MQADDGLREANRRAMVQAALERLESDLRVLSPLGIERAAWGWNRHERDHLEAYHTAERTALRAIETANEDDAWGQWRRRLFAEVEGRLALVAWRAERASHPAHVQTAERAAFGAALGLFAQPLIGHRQYATLVGALAEALPWLLPEQPPAPTGRQR